MDPQDYIDLKDFDWRGRIDRRKILIGVGILVLILLLLSPASFWYQVEANSQAVILRLGKYHRKTDPGLHFKLPFLEKYYIVPSQRQLKEEFGFRTIRPGIRTEYSPSRQFLDESLMLTGDLNVAVVEWSVQYRISDPYRYLFRVRSVDITFRDMAEAVMREVVGDRTVNEVLTVGRIEMALAAQEKLQVLCDQYENGIRVDQVILQNVTPPDPVKPSFNEVNQAQQERERLINEARAEYNLAVPKARGEADQMIRQAEGYAVDRVNRAKGEANRFQAIYAEYRKAPEVTRQRIYIETLTQLLPKVGRKVIVDKNSRNIIPLLQLGREAAQ